MSIVAGLGPERKGNPRHVALASNAGDGIAIHHGRYTRDDALKAFESVELAPRRQDGSPAGAVRLLDGCAPALHVGTKDDAWAAFLAVQGDQLLWVEAHFAHGVFGADNSVRATPLGAPGAKPVRGGLVYADDAAGAIVRREGVLLLETGKVVRIKDGTLGLAAVQGAPAMPVLLTAGRTFTYVLYADKERGPYFEPI